MASAESRTLGWLELTALGLNGVIGVGIFFVPAAVAGLVPGQKGASIYGLTAMACVPIALAFGRLGQRVRQDGGPYVFAREAFGPSTAFLVGWLAYVSAVFSTSAVIRGLAQSLVSRPGAPSWWVNATASAIAVGLALLAAGGLKLSARAWTVVTVLKITPLVVLLGAALVSSHSAHSAVAAPERPLAAGDVLRAGLIALFALQGFEIVPVPAGHVKKPETVASATLIGLLAAAGLYVGLHMACVRALPDLGASKAPLVDAARVYGGPGLARLLAVGTNLSAFGIALGMVAMSPRYLSALGRPEAFGSWIGSGNARGVPTRALVATAAAVVVLAQFGSLDELFAMSSIAVLTQYASTAASLIRLSIRRYRGLTNADTIIGIWAAVASLVVVLGAQRQELLRAVVVVVCGIGLRLVYCVVRGGEQ